MVKLQLSADDVTQSYFVSRLSLPLIRRIPQALIEGYADATRAGHNHLVGRRRAADRHFAVQDAWQRLGEDIPGVKVIKAEASNGGGPYFALELGGTLLTVHKVDVEATAPRWAAYRCETAKRNEPYQLMLEGLGDVSVVMDTTSQETLDNIRKEIAKHFNLYVMVTHCPDSSGDTPAFVNALVVNELNDVLAYVDVIEEARRLSESDATELKPAPIAEPQQRRRRPDKEASSQ